MRAIWLAVALAVSLLAGCGPASAAVTCPAVSARLGLHWPYSDQPENSLAAITAAHQAGAPKVEIDAGLSKYSVWVVIHDTTVSRTTTHTGLVSSYSARQLEAMRLRIGNGKMSSQMVPSLRSALSLIAAEHMQVSVEIKPQALTAGQAASIVALVTGSGARADVRSNVPAVLARVRAAGYPGHLTLITTAPELLPAGSPYWMESVEYAGPPALTAGDVAALGGAGGGGGCVDAGDGSAVRSGSCGGVAGDDG